MTRLFFALVAVVVVGALADAAFHGRWSAALSLALLACALPTLYRVASDRRLR